MIRSATGFFKYGIILTILSTLLVVSGCKVASDLTIDFVEAKATFNATTGVTTIGLWIRLKNNNKHLGNVKDWSFTIKEGNESLMVINKDNFKEVLGDGLHHFTDFDIRDQGSIYLDNWSQYYCRPYFGDLFNGRNPNQVEVTVDIKNGDEYRLSGNYSFTMERN